MKNTSYQNRYGDNIIFTERPDGKIEMTGYNPEWMRFGYANDYTEAYQVYLNQCNALTEPDYFYLIEDNNENKLRPMTFQEFATEVETNEEYRPYLKLTKSDPEVFCMVDPSGGPYIALGSDVGRYFEDGVSRFVVEIDIAKTKIIFTTTNQKKKNEKVTRKRAYRTKSKRNSTNNHQSKSA